MAHLRSRHLLDAFKKVSAHNPLTGLFGHRQTGKSTFLEAHSKSYISLDDPDALHTATTQPKEFLRSLLAQQSTSIAIDECQMAPPLFPVLKLLVQKNQRPNLFYLSGSVRFSSRKAIRESLTGRLGIIELYPMVLTELRKQPLNDFIYKAVGLKSWKHLPTQIQLPPKEHQSFLLDLEKYLNQGGLPGICFTRDQKTRERKLQDILSTILDRDLRLVYETKLPFNDISELCRYLATHASEPLSIAAASRKTKLAPKTIKSLIAAFQNIFLLREIPIEGTGSKGSLYLFEDQCEEKFLSNNNLSRDHQMTGAIYRNLRSQFEYRLGATPEYFQYRTRGGAIMPLCIRTDQGILGILHREKTTPLERAEKASIDSFLKTYLGSKVLILTTHKQLTMISDQLLIAPISLAL